MADSSTNSNMNSLSQTYPWTKMHFLVTIDDKDSGQAMFNEVTGMEATIDVIEFRTGNAKSFSPMKVPGLVKHGNITLKQGYTSSSEFREWAAACVSDTRSKPMTRKKVVIELLDVSQGMDGTTFKSTSANQYVFWDAWVAKYTAPDMNATKSEIAIETMEIAFERMEMPGSESSGGGGEGGGGEGGGGGAT